MIKVASADGTDVHAFDEGRGPVILVIHPGNDDGTSWRKVAARLSGRFRVVRIVRRQYRLDLPAPDPYSGGVVALEALAAEPSAFAGAVLFEPPVAIGPPAGSEATDRARSAIAAGQPGQAMQIFVRDVVGMRPADAWVLRVLVTAIPRMRALAPRQISDLDGVGLRLDAYARIGTPTVLLGGERSPAHLGERLDALAAVMPHASKVILARRDHSAHLKAPGEVAQVIETLASAVLQ